MEPEADITVRWVHASFSVRGIAAPLGAWLVPRVQAAGRLDARLRALDLKYGSIQREHQTSVDFELDEYMYLSLLWVLDAYEVVRTLDACVRQGMWSPSPAVRERLALVKAELGSVRMPLAKFEPRGRSGGARPGDLVPYPVLVVGAGAGWNVGEAAVLIVSRHGLADEVLSLFEAAASGPSGDPALT